MKTNMDQLVSDLQRLAPDLGNSHRSFSVAPISNSYVDCTEHPECATHLRSLGTQETKRESTEHPLNINRWQKSSTDAGTIAKVPCAPAVTALLSDELAVLRKPPPLNT